MNKLLGILPYIYFEEPIQLGNITFLSVPDYKGRDHSPHTKIDKRRLQELSKCFHVTRGLSTNKGAIKATTYFIVWSKKGKETETLWNAHKAITLLRYAILSSNSQALDNTEATYLYAFALPPAGGRDYSLYQCWPNLDIEKEIWVTPENFNFPLPGWYVDLKMVHTSQLEDIEDIKRQFYGQKKTDNDATTILAIEWYNQSFLKYSLRNISGRLVDIATAFETLFQLPLYKKTEEFRKRIREYLGIQEGSLLDNWATDFYSKVRSETVHKGKPVSFLFQHPEAQMPHLSFLWMAQRIFRECLAVKTGLPRHIDNNKLIDELTPNEVHLNKLRDAGSFEKILKDDLLEEIEKLREIYPVGKRKDIIWLGKTLLNEYSKKYKPKNLLPVLNDIISSNDNDFLGWQYYRFFEEFKRIYPGTYLVTSNGEPSAGVLMQLKPITRLNVNRVQLESAIYHFVKFAAYALTRPSRNK